MSKNSLSKLGIAGFFLLILVSYVIYSQWQQQHFTVNPESFHIAENKTAVFANDYKKIPPLRLAYQYQLLENIEQTVNVPGKKRKITIHKIWNSRYGFLFSPLYILYSINLQANDDTPADVPKLTFQNLVLKTANGRVWEGPVSIITPPSATSIVYNKQLYRGIFLEPAFAQQPLDDYKYFARHLTRFQLKQPVLAFKQEDHLSLSGLTLTHHYQTGENILFKQKLQQEIQLNDHKTLQLHKIVGRPFKSSLLYDIKGEQATKSYGIYIYRKQHTFEARSPLRSQLKHSWKQSSSEKSAYELLLPPIQSQASQLTYHIVAVGLYKQQLKWRISTHPAAESQKVAQFFNQDIIFEGFSDKQKGQTTLTFSMTTQTRQPHNMMTMRGVLPYAQYRKFPSLQAYLKIRNANGEHPAHVFIQPSRQGQPYPQDFQVSIDQSFVKNSQHIQMTLVHIPYIHKIKPQMIHINLPSSGTT